MEGNQIIGSVIQRSIVPQEISTILNIATCPIKELKGHNLDIVSLTSEILGVASSDFLNESEYKKSIQLIAEPEFWHDLEHFYYEIYGPPFEIFVHEWYRYFRRWHEKYIRKIEKFKVSLSEDLLICQLAGININNIPTFSPILGPIPFFAFPIPDFDGEFISKYFSRFQIEPEKFLLALKIRTASYYAPKKVREAIVDIYQYDIPFGQSPETESELLKNIIKHAKSVIVAPLITGAMGTATLISNGQYILAIECALTSSATTLIFVGTASIVDKILNYIASKRRRK